MRIFFMGATGVIGRRALPLLVADGHSVTAAIRDDASREQVIGLGATPIAADLFDRESLRRALPGHDVVINMATHIPSSVWKMMFASAWRENDRVRTEGSRNLVDAALACGVQRFVQESFAPAYPDCADEWIDESTPLEPPAYSRSILDAESANARFGEHGTGVVLRFGAFYGPDAAQTRGLIAAVRHGLTIVPGAPEAFISSISHDDAAGAVVAALRAPGGTYNAVDDEPMPRSDYLRTLAAALGVPPPRPLPAWTLRFTGSVARSLARSLRISNRKLCTETGWRPRYPSLREGWPATLAEIDHVRTPPRGRATRPSARHQAAHP